MLHASDFESISIRGRFAFALACLEALAAKWNVGGDYFGQLLALLWEFTSRPMLASKRDGDWWRDFGALRGGKWDDLVGRIKADNPGLSSDQLHAIRHACEELYRLGGTDMYAQPQVWNSIPATLNVAGILIRWGVPLPALAPFARSRWDEHQAFGATRTREFFMGEADAPVTVALEESR
jgi:hypothetical protein